MKQAKTNSEEVRPVTEDDIGLKVLHEAPAEASQIIECVGSCSARLPKLIVS